MAARRGWPLQRLRHRLPWAVRTEPGHLGAATPADPDRPTGKGRHRYPVKECVTAPAVAADRRCCTVKLVLAAEGAEALARLAANASGRPSNRCRERLDAALGRGCLTWQAILTPTSCAALNCSPWVTTASAPRSQSEVELVLFYV